MNQPTCSDSPTAHGQRGTVFIVDDDVQYLRALERLLRVAGFQVAAYTSAAKFLNEVKPGTAGCLITDLMMPGMDGMALQEALHGSGNPLPVLFLSGQGDIPTTVRAMRGGAEDFLTKLAPKADLIAAVNRALARNEQERANRARLEELRKSFELLTSRELEILRHVLQGQLNKQIAADLGIHERTVKLHRTSITTKLRVHSVAELTRMAQQVGLFE